MWYDRVVLYVFQFSAFAIVKEGSIAGDSFEFHRESWCADYCEEQVKSKLEDSKEQLNKILESDEQLKKKQNKIHSLHA